MHRILIIGAGLVGASLAFRLARTGADVTIIDAAQPASAATGASFGWINASFFHSQAHFNLRAAAIAAHHRLDRDLTDTGTLWSGCLWWEKEGAELDAQGQALTGLGYTVHDLDARQIAAREPALAPPQRCLFLPDEGAVDASRLTHRLLAASGSGSGPTRPSAPSKPRGAALSPCIPIRVVKSPTTSFWLQARPVLPCWRPSG